MQRYMQSRVDCRVAPDLSRPIALGDVCRVHIRPTELELEEQEEEDTSTHTALLPPLARCTNTTSPLCSYPFPSLLSSSLPSSSSASPLPLRQPSPHSLLFKQITNIPPSPHLISPPSPIPPSQEKTITIATTPQPTTTTKRSCFSPTPLLTLAWTAPP